MQAHSRTHALSASSMDALREGIVIISASGAIEWVNASMCQMLGRSADDVVGHSVHEPPWNLESPSVGMLDASECPAALALRGIRQPELTLLLHAAGAPRWVKVRTVAADPFDPARGVTMLVEDLSQLVEAQHGLERALNADPLTGLATRNRILSLVEASLPGGHPETRAQRVGVLHVDLDGFRLINDSFGSTVGDAVLVEVASRLRSVAGHVAEVGRMGVDEFLVLVTTDDPSLAFDATLCELADEIRRSLAVPVRHDGMELHLTASLGAARAPEDASDGPELLAAADRAVRAGRQSGRNQFRFHDVTIDIRNQDRINLDRSLRLATARRELEVYYQPIVQVASGRVCGAEALVRWHHPQRGPVPPGEFIPTAETTGTIGAISDFVLETVGNDIRGWTERGVMSHDSRISVNISASEFNRPDLLDRMERILRATGTDPSRIELEITESVLLDDLSGAAKRLEEIDRLGMRVAIDDFGTGYSSLSYLHELPLHTLKIDRRFITEVSRGRAGAVTRTILDLARNLGFTAVAEGLEHDHQLEFLARNGCELAQGFLFAPPLPRESFEQHVA